MLIDPRTHFIISNELCEEIVEFTKNNDLFGENDVSIGSRKEASDYKKQFVNINRIDVPLREKIAKFSAECYKFWDIEVKREYMFGNFISVTSLNYFYKINFG